MPFNHRCILHYSWKRQPPHLAPIRSDILYAAPYGAVALFLLLNYRYGAPTELALVARFDLGLSALLPFRVSS